MAQTIGRQNNLGIARETTRNTAQSTATVWLPWMVWDSNVKNIEFKDESSAGIRDQLLTNEIAGQYVEAKLEGKLNADTFVNIIYYFFGDTTAPTTALGATSWAFKPANNILLPAFTAFFQKSDVGWLKINGCTIKEIEIKAEAGGDASYSCSIIGFAEATSSTQTPVYIQPAQYLYGKYIKIGYSTTTGLAALSSPTFFDARSVTIKLTNNSKEDMALGSLTPADIYAGSYSADVSFSAILKPAIATTFDAAYKIGTKYSWTIQMTNTNAQVIGTSTLKPLIQVNFPQGRFNVDYKIEKDNAVMIDGKIIPEYGYTDACTTQIKIQNATASIL